MAITSGTLRPEPDFIPEAGAGVAEIKGDEFMGEESAERDCRQVKVADDSVSGGGVGLDGKYQLNGVCEGLLTVTVPLSRISRTMRARVLG